MVVILCNVSELAPNAFVAKKSTTADLNFENLIMNEKPKQIKMVVRLG